MKNPLARGRDAYPYLLPIQTRWMDNDVYGHVNNVVYYSYFDTVVNEYLLRERVLDFESSDAIGLVVQTQCEYFSSVAFPDRLTVGLCAVRIGTSSVRYEIGLFRECDAIPAAQGHFVHVYVDRVTRKPKPLSDALRAALMPLLLIEQPD
ncbi:thioesterase [Paraburkholderia monticola]|uniref:Thioesterase n=1 Tax=Paraburkholderia monticola TaxID=1399968 RepID=A0A149PD57_9BURK|nr:thioesterase family protein [Paraburkholderia monticola]KXU82950.1 thioesterase [Paraburkholderia monticola]